MNFINKDNYNQYDYINHLIDKVMRYSFETKANKIYANKVDSNGKIILEH